MEMKKIKKKLKKELRHIVAIIRKKLIVNYYKTNFNKNVLISYIDNPFKNRNKVVSHSNQEEALVISKVFKELGFNVDIVKYGYKSEIKLKKYDLIFGFGNVFEKSFYDEDFRGKRIFYATTAEPTFQMKVDIERTKEFNKRNNTNLLPKRLCDGFWPLSWSLSDVIIMIGNDWTKSTWEKRYDGLILKQVGSNVFFENFKISEKQFAFIGSLAAIHKGLDLCIEIFKSLPQEYVLNIFAHYEEDFFEIYGKLPENIKFHGFKNINSDEFKNILGKCSFIIAPSCSEGQMTSLILGIGNGLLPLATRESGVDLPEELIIEKFDSEYLKDKILEIYNLEEKEYNEKILKLQNRIKQEHTLKAFEECFRENIKIISEKIFK